MIAGAGFPETPVWYNAIQDNGELSLGYSTPAPKQTQSFRPSKEKPHQNSRQLVNPSYGFSSQVTPATSREPNTYEGVGPGGDTKDHQTEVALRILPRPVSVSKKVILVENWWEIEIVILEEL